jgi:hypothetical protein
MHSHSDEEMNAVMRSVAVAMSEPVATSTTSLYGKTNGNTAREGSSNKPFPALLHEDLVGGAFAINGGALGAGSSRAWCERMTNSGY